MCTEVNCGMLSADDECFVSKSTEDHSKMAVIVAVFESEDLTLPGTETEITLLHTLN